MSDYELFLALTDEYKDELKQRMEGCPCRVWDSEKAQYETQHFRPNNKRRLNRLRLELSALMLRMERKMNGGCLVDKKEGWE